MRVVIQRVLDSSVSVDDKIVGKISKGYTILASFTLSDNKTIVDKMVTKILNLRIFEDEEGKMNRSIIDEHGEILSISQFTLYASLEKGNRPSFNESMPKEGASLLYEYFNNRLKESGLKIESGIFHSDMKLNILNDGPCTIILDSDNLFKK